MSSETRHHTRRMIFAALFLLAGAALEALSLSWNSAVGFLTFLIGGGGLTAIGVLLYLGESVFGPGLSLRRR